MAKGDGWMMAVVLGGEKVAHLQGTYQVCPVCGGPMEPGSMTEQYFCQSETQDNMPGWLKVALEAQGFNPRAFYPQDGAIRPLCTAKNGVALIPMRDRGFFGGWRWDGIPEGEITFPDWFPIRARDEYVKLRMASWEKELQVLLTDPDCGELKENHPVLMIEQAQYNINKARNLREKEIADKEKVAKEQAELEHELTIQGFFYGSIGNAHLPEGTIMIMSDKFGCRADRKKLVAGPKLTIEQLKALVQAVGDSSIVVMEGRFPVIETPNPAKWIGRSGYVAKALAAALNLRFLKIIEKK